MPSIGSWRIASKVRLSFAAASAVRCFLQDTDGSSFAPRRQAWTNLAAAADFENERPDLFQRRKGENLVKKPKDKDENPPNCYRVGKSWVLEFVFKGERYRET